MIGPKNSSNPNKDYKVKGPFSKRKRSFIKSIIFFGALAIFFPFYSSALFSDIRILFYRIYGRIRKNEEIPPDNERVAVSLPNEGEEVSVETALNSRCTSDYDENQNTFHWGVFDSSKKLSQEQIEKVISLARIPRFTQQRMEIKCAGNMITFVVVNHASSGLEREWLMVESGIQQQAVVLVCAALGVGMVFRSLGDNGNEISEVEHAVIKFKLDAMKPSYNNSFWTNSAPSEWKTWQKGNLSNPVRSGRRPLIEVLQSLETENIGAASLSEDGVSQLLWAARGRTPHLYKSRPWGMTIPVSRGDQNISSVYLITKDSLSKYVNWENDRPTHSLKKIETIEVSLQNELEKLLPTNSMFIAFGRNEDSGRAYWEVGYQMLNLLLQARALYISYKAILFNEIQKEVFEQIGVERPAAALLL